MNKKFELLKEAVGCYKANHVSGDKNEKELLKFIDELQAISVTRCCTELQTIKELKNFTMEWISDEVSKKAGSYLCFMENGYVKMCYWDGQDWADMWETSLKGKVKHFMKLPKMPK